MHQNSEYCKNCGQHLLLNQKFCHQCGQKADTHRINFHFLVHEIQHSIFHVDGGIFYTLKHLFTRPGHMLREYLEGKRIHHFKPVLMLIIMGSVNGLLNLLLNGKTDKKSKTDVMVNELTMNPETKELSKALDFKSLIEYFISIAYWFANHVAFLILLIIPAVALAFFLGFRKYRINYAEWLIIMTYFGAMALAINFPFLIFEKVFNDSFSGIYLLIILGLLFWIMLQFFNTKAKIKVVLRTIWSQFLVTFFTTLFIIISGILIIVVGVVIHGNYQEMKKINTEVTAE